MSAVNSNIAPVVDQLGEVKAQIAKLTEKETELKSALSEMGPGAYDGVIFRATVSSAPRTTLDSKSIYRDMDTAWIAGHSQTKDVETVRVTSRSAEASGESEEAKSRGRQRAKALMAEIEGDA